MTYYGGKELADSFRTVRKNTLIIAEEIPEEHYDFKAVPEVRGVTEMLSHIAVSASCNYELHAVNRVTTFEGFDWGAFTEKRKEEEQRLRTKPQILEALRQEGEKWASWLQGLSEDFLSEQVRISPHLTPSTKSRFELLLSVKEHEMHHRAQLMLIQRLLGMVPHLTREREKMRQTVARAQTS